MIDLPSYRVPCLHEIATCLTTHTLCGIDATIDLYRHLQDTITNPTPSVRIIPPESIQNAEEVDRRSQNHKHVEYLMRASPHIETSWVELFRESRTVYNSAEEYQGTLRIVEWETRLFVELIERENSRCMNNWRECREAGKDKDREPEQPVLTALIGRMNHNVYGQSAKGPNLTRRQGQSFLFTSQEICRKESFTTYHCPICILQGRLTVEAHIDARNEISKYQDNNGGIVHTAPKIRKMR